MVASPDSATQATANGAANDAPLVEVAQRDPHAFAPLYARYFDAVYGYCMSRIGSHDLAEEATSRTFAQALAALPSCRPESFRSWLFAIAHNVVSDQFRRAQPAHSLAAAEELPDPTPSPEEIAVAAEQRRSLHALLAHLPEDQRRVMELRLSGLSGVETAAVLRRSPQAVRSLQFRAVARLRVLLGHDAAQEETSRP